MHIQDMNKQGYNKWPTCGSMLGARVWMTSWAGSEVDDGGPFLLWKPLPGGRGIAAAAEAGYSPWASESWYRAACLASASFFPTTNLGSGRSLTGGTEIQSQDQRKEWLHTDYGTTPSVWWTFAEFFSGATFLHLSHVLLLQWLSRDITQNA